jgi:hypothetical protein
VGKNVIFAVVIALVVGAAGGAVLGYRYADGRCAVDHVATAEATTDAAIAAIESGNQALSERRLADAAALQRDVHRIDRQLKETREYEQSIKNSACRIDPDSLRLLNDAIRGANAAIDAPAAD